MVAPRPQQRGVDFAPDWAVMTDAPPHHHYRTEPASMTPGHLSLLSVPTNL